MARWQTTFATMDIEYQVSTQAHVMVKVFGVQPHLSVLQSTAATLQSWKMVNKDFSTNPLFFSLLWLTSAVNPSCSTPPLTKISIIYHNVLRMGHGHLLT